MGQGRGHGAGADAPSVKRTDWAAWLKLAAAEGAAVGALALAALWRDLPGLPALSGSLGAHALCWAQLAANQLPPGLFADGARACAARWSGLGAAGRLAVEWRVVVAALAACAPAALTARRALTPRDGLALVRGPSRHEGREAARKLRAKFASQAKRRPDHPIARGVPWPADRWTRHTLIVGGVGSGKSTFLRPLIKRVVEAGDQALIFDPKGEFTEAFAQPAILAPWDARSLAWDIARDLRNTQDMRRFAAAMIRESSDPMWANAARQLLVGLLVYLRATRGRDWGWAHLAKLVFLSQRDLLTIMARWHPEAVRAVEKASVTTQGILINLASFCAPIVDLASAWGDTPPERRVSFRRWAAGKSRWRQIIVQGHGSYADLTKSCVEAVVGTIAARVNSVEMRDDPSRKLWFIADELPQAGKIPIRELFEVGRSRGVRCVVACQDFAQLEEVHGPLFVRALTSMCGTLVVGQMSPGETAERLCKTLGSREHERRNVSMSVDGSRRSETVSFSRESVPLYSPSELASRLGPTRDGKGVKLLVVAGGDAHELFYPIVRFRRAHRAHFPAAWTLGIGVAPAKPASAPSEPDKAHAPGEPDDAPRDAPPPGSPGAGSAPAGQSASFAAAGELAEIDPTVAEALASDFPEPGESEGIGESGAGNDGGSGDGEGGSRVSAACPSP
ncbi:TPA: type IV secretion system DNA-binding domain-containing protein [Burkholderia vietnamiensis]|nr:type IV secretion system DNA-binding domain-containing protein [Burkholderia vietnamiensis]HEP6283957.1 type IV secretion system DNA-binding domain-containing protein [Burkholderia vietnamiensis]HEP6309423.1 type IV secretion system DNA-binding domain-containing protein [Burkholderia vietnamiensis]